MENLHTYKISIIIPVYNTEDYLTQCLDSIINQSHKNLEIVLVDDGSTDNSGKICDNYEKMDKRIKVVHKSNSGVSDTRNVGIQNITGDYCCFIDSDDIVQNNFCESLLDACISNNVDMAFSNFKGFNDINSIEASNIIYNKAFLKNGPASCLWRHIFKVDIIKQYNIHFLPIAHHEDFLFVYEFFGYSKTKVAYVMDTYYFYRRFRKGSICNTHNYDYQIERISTAMVAETEKWIESLSNYPRASYLIWKQIQSSKASLEKLIEAKKNNISYDENFYY